MAITTYYIVQTCIVKELLSKRTVLELALTAISLVLAGVLVFAVIELLNGSRAADINWGSVADWTTAAVTLMGFVGAIAALRVQSTALGLQTEQHNTMKNEEQAKKLSDAAVAAETKREDKWRCAKAVRLEISAHRGSRMPGHQEVEKPPLIIECEVRAPRDSSLKNVAMATPNLPAGFRVREESKTQADHLEDDRQIRWSAQGAYWSEDFGHEKDAETWLRNRTSVTFTDPAGHTWKLQGTGALQEVAYSE